ncbi:MAG: hypothetical protein HQ549_01040 [Candidatus Omnitrophica bacterium]|nr:hypothetical protein [Candidatus Omnitrophota bacterium]
MKKMRVIHPFLFAISPVLFLFAFNIGQLSFHQIIVPLLVVLGMTFTAMLLLYLFLKNAKKAGIIITIFWISFFSYRTVYVLIEGWHVWGFIIGCHQFLSFAWVVLFVGSAYFTVKTRSDLHGFTKFLNISAISIVAISLVNISTYEFKTRIISQSNKLIKKNRTVRAHINNRDVLPNIYYIILDGYAREDILKELYEYDNAAFLEYLKQKGFYIANRSRSNYCKTHLSLASSLNSDFIHNLLDRIDVESDSIRPLNYLLNDSKVVRFLKERGYKFISFASGYSITEIKNADMYIEPVRFWDEFTIALVNTTPLPYVIDMLSNSNRYFRRLRRYHPLNLYKKKILYALDHLADVAKSEEPVFVFSHIICPHPPFIFGRDDEKLDLAEEFSISGSHLVSLLYEKSEGRRLYLKQLIFINSKIKLIIDRILSESSRPSIIILQADHGSNFISLKKDDVNNVDLKDLFCIFNAYFFSDNDYRHLYDSITPVNTFRVIFNQYFGAQYDLLEDESYLSIKKRPFKFINVSDKINSSTRN